MVRKQEVSLIATGATNFMSHPQPGTCEVNQNRKSHRFSQLAFFGSQPSGILSIQGAARSGRGRHESSGVSRNWRYSIGQR